MDRRRQRLAQALDETGLWRAAEPADRQAQLEAIRLGAYPLDLTVFDDVCFPADGDKLAEPGGIEALLTALGPELAEHGLRLKVRRHNGIVMINDTSCGDFRTVADATTRPLGVVNKLLAQAGATVRLFTLYTGGSQGLAYLVDPRVVHALRMSGLYDRRELPQLAAVPGL
jgi:hypothetical protein